MWKTSIVVLLTCAVINAAKFKVIREWNYLNFTWPDDNSYRSATSRGLYIPENNIIAGIKNYEDYFYITLPRMKRGVPATLTRIAAGLTPHDTAPLLMPFPSWEMNTVGDCDALQNVQNIEIDTKGMMWIIDGGRVETLGSRPIAKCPPKLIIYDIKNNMTSLKYVFPEEVASFNSSFLYDIVVDNSDGGYAYITDNSGKDPGIIVFSLKRKSSWKLRHSQSMRADPTAVSFRVSSVFITAPLNIAGIALGPKIRTESGKITISEEREVFYAPISSLHLYSINTSVLHNEDFAKGEYQGEVKDYGQKLSQSVGMIMDNQGLLYYNLLATYSIARWDTRTPFRTGQQLVARDEKYLEWPHSFAFDDNGNMTILVNKLNEFIYDRLDVDEPNFRLISASVGGKSYLYDETYDYQTDTTTMSNNTSTYQPMHTHAIASTNPDMTPVPQSTHDYMNHDLMKNITYTVHQNMTEAPQKQSASSSNSIAVTVVSILMAVMVFIV